MSSFFRKVEIIILLVCLIPIFISCNNKEKYKVDLSNNIEYIETPEYYTVNKVATLNNFKSLKKEDMYNLNKLLQNKKNSIWLKIDFTLPDELKNKDIGLFIEQLNSANRVWVNLFPCGSYGRFPPNELLPGFGGQHFSLNHSILKQKDTNTIYIQLWSGTPIYLSQNIFLSDEIYTYQTAERLTFFRSKIILCFTCISLIASIIYLLLHFFLKKFSKTKTYLYYSILMLFSTITLLPFCLNEIPWVKPGNISYFDITKILLTIGIYTTIFFVNMFIVSYIGQKENKFIIITRIVLYIFPLIATLTIKDYNQISLCLKYFFPIIFIQFIFSIIQAVKAFRDKTKIKQTILLIASVIPACIGFIVDLCSANFAKIEFILPEASIYGWQFTTIIFIIRLLKTFSEMYIKNTKLKNSMVKFNAKLENEVEIRTKELSEKNFILSRGLEAITLVQQEVLPKKNKTFKGWDIAVKYIPLDSEVSGDLYDYYFTNSKLDGLSIIDISGHGIPAGLMSILAKGIISQQYIDGVAHSRSMSDILLNINEIYIKEKVNVENYFTGLLFNFDDFDKTDNCKVEMANAGHPAPLLYSKKTDSVTELKYEKPEMQYGFIGIDGLPISFPSMNFKMSQNDILVCFTDGITEAMNNTKEEFSKQRLAKIINENNNLKASELLNVIMDALYKFKGDKHLNDDLTLIILKRDNSKDYLEEI